MGKSALRSFSSGKKDNRYCNMNMLIGKSRITNLTFWSYWEIWFSLFKEFSEQDGATDTITTRSVRDREWSGISFVLRNKYIYNNTCTIQKAGWSTRSFGLLLSEPIWQCDQLYDITFQQPFNYYGLSFEHWKPCGFETTWSLLTKKLLTVKCYNQTKINQYIQIIKLLCTVHTAQWAHLQQPNVVNRWTQMNF